jgi:hypothetical protein
MKLIGITGKKQAGKDTVATMLQYLNADKKYTDEEIISNLHKKPTSKFEKRQFAYPLKKLVSLLTGCKVSDLEDENFKNSKLPNSWKCYKCIITDGDTETYQIYTDFDEADKFIRDANFVKNEIQSNIKDNMDFILDICTPTYREVLQSIGTNLLRDRLHPNVFVNAMFKDSNINKKNIIISDVRFLNEAKAIKKRGGIIIKVEKENSESNDTHQSETESDMILSDYVISAKQGDLYSLLGKVRQLSL